jgi:hypothetical protein
LAALRRIAALRWNYTSKASAMKRSLDGWVGAKAKLEIWYTADSMIFAPGSLFVSDPLHALAPCAGRRASFLNERLRQNPAAIMLVHIVVQ